MNRVTGPHSAIVDGKSTALAGCRQADRCNVAHLCLRADPKLTSRADFPQEKGVCQCFIVVEASA